jgi:hypothetical protein
MVLMAGVTVRFPIRALIASIAIGCFVVPSSVPIADAKGSDPTLVSRASGSNGAASNGASEAPAISRNGRTVAFQSIATNLDPANTDPGADVYVRDLKADTTTLVSRASGLAGERGNGPSGTPSISADGRYVAFASAATNLVGDVPPGSVQVYVRDLVSGELTLVSRADGALGAPASGRSLSPSISNDGRLIAFSSDAPELTPVDVPEGREVFVRDLAAATTTLVSRKSGIDGSPAAGHSSLPAIAGDGTHVAFQSSSAVLSNGETSGTVLWVRDLRSSATILASRADGPNGRHAQVSATSSISADGTLTTFSASRGRLGPPASGNQIEVYLRSLVTDRTSLVSRFDKRGHRPKEFESIFPAISGNGRFVSFAVGPAEADKRPKLRPQGLFVRDLAKDKTEQLLKSPRDGTPSTLESVLSGSGRVVAFQSDSAKLSAADDDRTDDIYIARAR